MEELGFKNVIVQVALTIYEVSCTAAHSTKHVFLIVQYRRDGGHLSHSQVQIYIYK